MPLEFQTVDIPLGKLNTGTHPADIPIGDLVTCHNVSSEIGGTYTKRFGFSAITSLSAGVMRLAKLGASLLALTGTDCYSYNEATATWFNTGAVDSVLTSQEPVALNQAAFLNNSTRATAGNVTAHFWLQQDTGAVYYQLRSKNDDAIFATAVLDSTANFDVIHSIAVGQYIFVIYCDASTQVIRYARVDSTTGGITSAANFQTGANVYSTSAFLDVGARDSSTIFIGWCNNTPSIRVAIFNVSTLTTTTTSGVLTGDTPGTATSLAVCGTTGESGYLVYYTGAGALRAVTFHPTTLAATAGPTTITTITTPRRAGLVRYDSTHALVVFDHTETEATVGLRSDAGWALVDNGAVASSITTIRNMLLQSKPWTHGGNFYVNLFAAFYGSAGILQHTYFTARVGVTPFTMVATHAYRTAYLNGSDAGQLTDVDQPTTGVFAFDAPVSFKFLSAGSPRAGIYSFGIDFVSAARGLPVEALGETFFAGGVVNHYDGVHPVESNFLLYPYIHLATPGAVGSSGMDNGTYSYVAVFESADAAGNADRSTTSIPVSATTSAGAGLGKVTLYVDQLSLTALGWSTARQQGSISIFRTTASGSTYRYVGQALMDPTGKYATIVDQAHDSTIGSNRLLYTNGGVLDREPPIPSVQLITHRNRVWGISAADRRIIFYSGQLEFGEGAWFSSAQQFRVDEGGDVTAIASMDDKLIIFKKDRILYLVGDGPDQLGNNSTLQLPQLISADTGCDNPAAIVLTPNGLVFPTRKGMHTLTRALELIYMPEPTTAVELFPNIRSAVMQPEVREVRFEADDGVSSGQRFVYNYRDNRWMTHSTVADAITVDSITVGSSFYAAKSNGTVYKEQTSYLDAGVFVSGTVQTGWIRFAGKHGLVRAQRLEVYGSYGSAFDLGITVARDYNSISGQDVKSYTNATLLALGLTELQLDMHLPRQQSDAFQVTIADSYSSGTLGNGKGFSLQSLGMVVGVKRGAIEKRLGATAKV